MQWATAGVSASHKFIQRIWGLNQKVLNRKQGEINSGDEKKLELKFNEYIAKITDLIENFQLNVAVAKIYEIASLMENNLEKKIRNENLIILQNKFMKILLPFAPHLSCECLSKLEGKNFYEEIQWPKANKSLLGKKEVTLVVQINGKKRGLIITKKDLSEKDALVEAKKIENIQRNLKGKKIVKNIFVKNKIINFIIN